MDQRQKRIRLILQRNPRGSKWYYGAFVWGLTIDSHPRFLIVCFCFGLVEVGVTIVRRKAGATTNG
jgi:hypothetical protein